MKFRKSIFAGVVVGTLGLAPALTTAQDMQYDNRKSIEDDSSLAPGVPGVTAEDHLSAISRGDVWEMEQALADSGYDPGPVDGVVDAQTRAAIKEFQSDHELIVTGIVDAETGELLGIVITQTS